MAHIPEDFNLDIETQGNITGFNPNDSKLVSVEVILRTPGFV